MKKVIILYALLGLLSSVVVILPTYAESKYSNQAVHRFGAIEGVVVTKEGIPVADAKVYVLQTGRSLLAATDGNGRFALTRIPPGTHRVIAYKESDGFPNLVWSFYSEAYQDEGSAQINVLENQTVRDVRVRLGPKASRLLLTVTDAKTGQPITDASVSLNHKGKPNTLFKSGATESNGTFNLLIPSSILINVAVEAQGYRTWRYVKGGAVNRDAIRFLPGISRRMTVRLERVTN